MAQCMAAVTPLLMQLSYHSLALSHPCHTHACPGFPDDPPVLCDSHHLDLLWVAVYPTHVQCHGMSFSEIPIKWGCFQQDLYWLKQCFVHILGVSDFNQFCVSLSLKWNYLFSLCHITNPSPTFQLLHSLTCIEIIQFWNNAVIILIVQKAGNETLKTASSF